MAKAAATAYLNLNEAAATAYLNLNEAAALFGRVAWTIVLPIFVLIGVGAILNRVFKLDRDTLNKLNLYVFVPALVFFKFSQSDLGPADIGKVGVYWLLLIILMWTCSAGVGYLLRLNPDSRRTISVGAMFPNAGNYGIPAQELAFGITGVSVQAVVIVVHNIFLFTLGAFLIASGGPAARQRPRARAMAALGATFRLPVMYAIAAAFIFRAHPEWLPSPLHVATGMLSHGLVPVALLTLGAQLANSRLPGLNREIQAMSLLRLVAAPLLGWGLTTVLGIPHPLAGILIVSASFPAAVNTALLAIEFRRSASLAAAGVFWTTLLSAVTVTATLALVSF